MHEVSGDSLNAVTDSLRERKDMTIVETLARGVKGCHAFDAFRRFWITIAAWTLALMLLSLSAVAQDDNSSDDPPQPTLLTSKSEKADSFGPVAPENLTPVLSYLPESRVTNWLQHERIRLYGWADGGYTYTTAGHGLLSIVDGRYATAPTPNRFGDEFILNGAWVILDRVPSNEGWSWGFRSDFYAGSEAALFHPLNGFGPTGKHFGTDFRQIYFSLHAPILSKRRVFAPLLGAPAPFPDGNLAPRKGRVHPVVKEKAHAP
jgi:hypothetical protein